VRYRVRALAVSALAISLAVAGGCAKNTGSTGGTGGGGPQKQEAIQIDKEGKSPTPAPEVPGAKKGGTLTWLEDGAPEHLNPQNVYVTDASEMGTVMFRQLTSYIEDPNGGPLKLVGDLAKNTGEASADNKTWTYHLRDGIKFDDGTPITSKDIAYGISRSFGKQGENGPQYVQQALDPKKAYKFAAGTTAPGISTPDDKTIVFTFPDAHPETPYIMALYTSTPVPAAKDTGDGADVPAASPADGVPARRQRHTARGSGGGALAPRPRPDDCGSRVRPVRRRPSADPAKARPKRIVGLPARRRSGAARCHRGGCRPAPAPADWKAAAASICSY